MKSGTRRTTLTISSESLAAAERIARKRRVTVSVVVSEALAENLRAKEQSQREGQRRAQLWQARRQAHAHLTDGEMLLLNGIVLSEPDESI